MRFAGWLAVVSLLALVALTDPVGAQATKDKEPPKDKKDPLKDKKEEAPSYIQGKTLHDWTQLLKSPDPSVRQQAVQNIVAFGPVARQAVPTMVEQLAKEPDVSLRSDMAAALGMLGGMERGIDTDDVPKVVQALLGLLSSTEYQRAVRLQAVLALAQIGPRARSAVPTLVKNAQDNSSWQVRKAVCFALGRIGADPSKGPDPSALGTLLTCCKDAAGPVRFEAILALSALGLSPRPTEVVQEKKALVSLLNDPDKNIAIWARVLLMFLDESYLTPKSLVYLTNFLKKDSDPKIRSAAARAIGTLGPKAKSLIPDLFDALNDKELDVILNALSALGMMIEVSPTVLPELESRLNDSEVAVRAHVAGVLGHVGEPAKAAVPKLTAALRDKEVGVVYQVIVALTRMGPPAAPALATLDDLAKNHKDESIRQAAEEAAKIIRELAAKKKP